VSAPKNKENAHSGESGDQRPKRRRDKLIRLDDLIPKQDVKGGRQLLFGVCDTTQQQTQQWKVKMQRWPAPPVQSGTQSFAGVHTML